MHDLQRITTPSERTALRAYRVQAVTTYISVLMFTINAALAAVELGDDHLIGLPARLGFAAVTLALWVRGATRTLAMRRRNALVTPLDLLQEPGAWLPSLSLDVASIDGTDVQLLSRE
jgi:hypothetical protein